MSARSMRRRRLRDIARQERRRKFSARRSGLAAGLAMTIGAAAPASADAAIFKVDKKGDAGNGTCAPRSCNLREAVRAAGADAQSDTILFASHITGEITLRDELLVSEPVTIRGPGARALTLSGDSDRDGNHDFSRPDRPGDTRIFHISANPNDADAGDVRISGLTLSGGVASPYDSGENLFIPPPGFPPLPEEPGPRPGGAILSTGA